VDGEHAEVHAAKVPLNRPIHELLVRPPDGVSVSTDPESAGWRYLSFRALALRAGEEVRLDRPEQEAVVVTIRGGGFSAHVGSETYRLPGRPSVFEGMPWAIYLPPGSDPTLVGMPIDGHSTSVIAYGQAPIASGTASRTPIVVGPDAVEIEVRGAGHATRQVNNIVMPDFPAERLLVCEVYTPGGNWSGWPPHRHDVDDMPHEAVLEETYYYQIKQPEGWGVARLYFHDGRPDGCWAVRSGDLLEIVEGYHPYSAPPDYDGYYLNFLAGDRRTMAASDDPELSWVRDSWSTQAKDPRIPMVTREVAGALTG
jgi:5-deoxy-glucuronate isomerase